MVFARTRQTQTVSQRHHSAEQHRDSDRKFVARDDLDREFVAYLRNTLGWSTYKTAAACGCSHATVSRIARDIPEPDATRLRAEHDPEVLALAAREPGDLRGQEP